MIALWYRYWAVWFAPIFGALIVFGRGADGSGEGYRLALASSAAQALAFVAPVCAVVACWEGTRLRSGRVLEAPAGRSRWAIVGVPAMVCFLVPAGLFVAWIGSRSGWAGVPVMASTSLALVAWTLTGLVFGLILPTVVALPVSLVVPAAVLILPPAIEPLWVRHLSGAWDGCCLTSEVLSAQALSASLVFNLTLACAAAAVLTLLFRARRWVAVLVAVLVLCVGLVGAGSLASGLGSRPVSARTGDTLCQTVAGAQVCLWPDHDGLQSRVGPLGERIFERWRRAGVIVPSRFDEAEPSWGTADIAPLFVSLKADDTALVISFAAAMVGPTTCAPGHGTARAGVDPTSTMVALLLVDDQDREVLIRRFGEPAVSAAADFLRLDSAGLQKRIADVRACR